MPKIQKQFYLELTVEQFLNACSHIELQEIELRLDTYLKKAEHDARRKAYREGGDPEVIIPSEEIPEGYWIANVQFLIPPAPPRLFDIDEDF